MSFLESSLAITSWLHSSHLFTFIFTMLLATMSTFAAYKLRRRKPLLVPRQKDLNETRPADTRGNESNALKWSHNKLHDTSTHSSVFSQKLFGLIIGIDNYPALPSLYGAVADANAMTDFLRSDLEVPREHIVDLRNEQATRTRIIQEFQALWKHTAIEPDDPILIYYAGHGGLARANKGWKERYGAQKIQVIFPFDYRQEQDVPGSEGTESLMINCIPDRTIATLLNKLASEKGNNITVIFDSCHSASATRDSTMGPGPKELRRARRGRSAKVDLDIPHDIDDDLFASEGIEPLPEKQEREAQLLLHTDQSSHIHFAACGTNELAIENEGRGVFTAELLKKMRESGVDNITYHNLMKFLEITEYQSPQCYGKHKDRILFDARVSSRNVAFITSTFRDDTWTLEAGAASGVTLESIWELHKIPTENSESVGRFKATDLYGSVTILQPLDLGGKYATYDGEQLYARCIHVSGGNELILRVWMSLEERQFLFPGPGPHTGRTHKSGIGYIMASSRNEADVVLEIHQPQAKEGSTGTAKPEVAFYWCDTACKKYKATKLGKRVPAGQDEVDVILFAAARWQWHLRRTKPLTKSLCEGVTMSMLKVANRKAVRCIYLEKPQDVVANNDGAIEFVVDNLALYGFKLKSKIRSALYVRMFYFDSADFSIGDIFGHNTGCGERTFDVAPEGELLIGGGASGGSPVRFSLSSGNQVEVGYMKVFWSTEPLELDHIKQKSAFKMRPGEMRAGSVDRDGLDHEWGTVSLALVLREQA
ncbi:unnamed protein product [Rhizoctonia solani]|uniref:Peptidase C14 caspase domain-containing protein n=1 Tax=Rhizoctonia solani TaxID=456999 RepID=A0A8H2WMY4_9AGAM|nr:unnamed protein product [Rhizoctonia solani]